MFKNIENPYFSIIVPVYNTEQYIRLCLDSIISQTFRDIEIIIVDDKGTDNSMEIVQEYAKRDSRIIIIENETNQGVAYSRNSGLEKATGKYISFIDSDDYIEPNYLYEMMIHSEEGRYDIVKGNFITEFSDRKILSDMNPKIRKRLSSNEFAGIEFTYAFWNAIYRRSVIEDNHIRFPNLKNGEDMVFLIKFLLCSKNFQISDTPIYHYRQHEASASKKISESYIKSIFLHYHLIIDAINKSNISKRNYINFFQYAIVTPLLNHHFNLVLEKIDNTNDIKSKYYRHTKYILKHNKYIYETLFLYPNPIYTQILLTKSFTCDRISCLERKNTTENNTEKSIIKINILGIPLFKIKTKNKKSKLFFIGIPIIEIKNYI